MEHLRPKMGNPLEILFISVLLISYIPNVSKKTYHGTGENQFYVEHIGSLVSITLCQIMEQLRPKMGDPLVIIVLSVLLILCINNV